MVDLGLKTLLHDKVRFLITVSGVAFAVTFFVFDNVPPDWGCICDLITDYFEAPMPSVVPLVPLLGDDGLPWPRLEEADDVEVEVVGGGRFTLPGQQRRPD